MKFNDSIFRKYDIRGIVGSELDKNFAVLLGKAFGTIVRKKNQSAKWVSIGQDVRISSKELAEGLIEGIISTGLNVYDIGICPTPLQYFSIFNLNLDGGIMVTGSHNPPEYNGFKISVGNITIHSEDIQDLKEIILNKKWINSENLGKVETYNILEEYQRYMIKEFAYLNDESKYRKVKIVVDAGNGTAGAVAPQILKNIGCEVIELYCEPDGTFPNHHPDPTVIEYIQDLIKKVREVNADIGVGYDGDADRIGIINKNGGIVWGDYIMIILSRAILIDNPQAKIIGDVKCSQAMFDDIENHGGIPIMWKTGHSLIRDKMWKENAILAGEFSGHIFIADRYFGYDDAIYITLRLVEIMKKTGKEIQELLLDIPKMYCTPEIRIECPDEIKNIIIEKILNNLKLYLTHKRDIQIKKIDETDGARVVFDKGWGLLRTSNTQPVIVMRIEAQDEKSLKKYKDFLELQLKAVKG